MPIDYRTYAPDWKLRSRFVRFYRAKNRCEWCDAENYQPHPVTRSRVILTVAHIDQDKRNNNLFNLAALCQRCHLRHDAKQHAANAKETRRRMTGQMKLF